MLKPKLLSLKQNLQHDKFKKALNINFKATYLICVGKISAEIDTTIDAHPPVAATNVIKGMFRYKKFEIDNIKADAAPNRNQVTATNKSSKII